MRIIKHKIIISALTVALLMSTTACSDFLTQDSKTSLTEEQAFGSIDLIEPTVQGIYMGYRDCRHDRDGLMPLLGLDESQQGHFQVLSSGTQAGMDQYNGLLSSSSTQVKVIWDKRWPMVNTAAKAIYALDNLTEGDADRIKQVKGEACFLRALIMMELTMYFGDVPIKDKAREKELGLGRQPIKDVWEQIFSDLDYASKNLPPTWTDAKRATSDAAYAMLGKAYMSAPIETGFRDFSKAKSAFDEMMGNYDLVPDFADLFEYSNPNSVESIFELQFSPIYPDNNKWQFSVGSRAVDAWFGQGCYFSGYDFLLPTKFAYETIANGGIWEDGDTRKDASIRYDFTYNGVTPDLSKTSWTGTSDELDPHIKKFEDPRTDKDNMWNSGKNLAVIRLADIILLYAECLNELGDTPGAMNLVNTKVRARAWGGTLPADKHWTGMNQQQFREAVMDERIRELCFEGWRRQDLIRTGMFVKLIKERNRWAREAATIEEYNTIYPIPDTELRQNEDMSEQDDQNPGYK